MKTKPETTTVATVGRWGKFPTFAAKVGTMAGSNVLVKRARAFYVNQRIDFAEEHHLAGMSVGMAPKWRHGSIWKIENDRLYIELT